MHVIFTHKHEIRPRKYATSKSSYCQRKHLNLLAPKPNLVKSMSKILTQLNELRKFDFLMLEQVKTFQMVLKKRKQKFLLFIQFFKSYLEQFTCHFDKSWKMDFDFIEPFQKYTNVISDTTSIFLILFKTWIKKWTKIERNCFFKSDRYFLKDNVRNYVKRCLSFQHHFKVRYLPAWLKGNPLLKKGNPGDFFFCTLEQYRTLTL